MNYKYSGFSKIINYILTCTEANPNSVWSHSPSCGYFSLVHYNRVPPTVEKTQYIQLDNIL